MIRRVTAGLIVVALAVGVWVLWPREEPDTTPTTTVGSVATTVRSTTTSTTTPPTTLLSTTAGTSHVVTTVEEAEEILRELWFGWFEGIYNQDEDRIREVVGSQQLLDAARAAFGTLGFTERPSASEIRFSTVEILRADGSCLVMWVEAVAPFVDASEPTVSSVEVLRAKGGSWYLLSTWQFNGDLWEADCESRLEPLS